MHDRSTPASEALTAWWKTLSLSAKRAVAQQCGVTFNALHYWCTSNTRPSAHCRTILETLSGGKVLADEWLFPSERLLVASARPLVTEQRKTGTDDG